MLCSRCVEEDSPEGQKQSCCKYPRNRTPSPQPCLGHLVRNDAEGKSFVMILEDKGHFMAVCRTEMSKSGYYDMLVARGKLL
jgi:hypothetical protein